MFEEGFFYFQWNRWNICVNQNHIEGVGEHHVSKSKALPPIAHILMHIIRPNFNLYATALYWRLVAEYRWSDHQCTVVNLPATQANSPQPDDSGLCL